MSDNANFEVKPCADGCGAQLAVTKRQISLYGADGWFLTEHAKQATDKTAAPYQPEQQPEGNIMANQPTNQPRQPAQMPNQPREGEQQNPNEQQQNPGQQQPAQPQKQ